MDYQRLVSYIYSYPEGVKGRNVGFAKALVHQGQFKLNISLRGVKTDSPEMFGIYMMVTDGGYRLIKLGECLVKMGQMEYSGIFNPDNINETGYGFKDICGLAVAREDARYDCMMSMWKDEDVTPDMLVFSGMDAKKQVEAGIVIKERMRQSEEHLYNYTDKEYDGLVHYHEHIVLSYLLHRRQHFILQFGTFVPQSVHYSSHNHLCFIC